MASPTTSEDDSRELAEMTEQLTLSNTTGAVGTPHGPDDPPALVLPTPTPEEGHALQLQDSENEQEEDPLNQSLTGLEDEVGKLLRTTVEELKTALQEARKLLTERDEELDRLRLELERYKQQAAREIANKTKLAQALDESHTHARELEELLQQWQLEVRETKVNGERARTFLQREQNRSTELERRLQETYEQKDKEIEQLKTQLIEARQHLSRKQGHFGSTVASDSNPGPSGMDKMQLHFLKQAVYHLLTDFHAEDQLRAIVSILDFSAQERKAVYARVQERKGGVRPTRSSGVH